MVIASGKRYILIYALLMAALPLHFTPYFGAATYLVVTAALIWLYRARVQATGQFRSATAAMVFWLLFGLGLLLAINGRSMGFLPIESARVLLMIAIPALGVSWLCSVSLWRGWTLR